jgi:hypothetical protein
MIKYDLNQIKTIPIFNFLENWNRKTNSDSFIYENCPFCSHKWHFVVNKQGSLFYSHNACIKGGSVIDFIQAYENLNFHDSIKFLADKFNVSGDSLIYVDKKKIEKLKRLEEKDSIREKKIINDFFQFLKIKMYDKTFLKVYTWDNIKLLHYIYDLHAYGAYNINKPLDLI